MVRTCILYRHSIHNVSDTKNKAITEGTHAHVDSFAKRIGQKTHFLGQTVPAGNIWQAKGSGSAYHYLKQI
jgi:ribosomal protein L27